MKCDNLKAYLDKELTFCERLVMAAHVKTCPSCRQHMAEWSGLSREIDRLEGEPVPPALRQRLVADAMTAAASAKSHHALPCERPRAQGVFAMKRAILVSAFAVLLVAAGFWLLPGKQADWALADMARAMADVQTVHFTGFSIDDSGGRRPVEGWVKGTSRIRIRVDGIRDIADDGKRLVAVERDYLPKVTIRNSGRLQGLARGMTYLDLFSGPGALRSAVEANGAEIIDEKKEVVGGRELLVTELKGDVGARMRIFTDPATNLLARSETYDPNGKLIEVIERVAYDVPVDDSVFALAIPRDLPVLDMVSPSPDEIVGNRKAEFERLQKDPNVRWLYCAEKGKDGSMGSCGGDIHPGYNFEVFGPGFVSVQYLADRNMYLILGRGQAYKNGWRSDMVEDNYIRLPGIPQVEEVLMLDGKVGEYCAPEVGAYRIQNIGPGPATVTYHRTLEAFVIRGRAKLLPTGRIYTNEVVKVDARYGSDIVEHINSGGKLDWGSLPQSEIESMKADIDVALRYAEIKRNALMIDGVKYTSQWGTGSRINTGIRFLAAGPGRQIWMFGTSDERQYYVVGRCRLEPSGKIVKNGVVSSDGTILSSE